MLDVASLWLLLGVLAGDPLVLVEGASTCPSPAQVTHQLERFLPPRPQDVEPDAARIDVEAGGTIHVELRRPDGTLVGERRLGASASCAELAEAVGIVVAMWEWPLRPGLVPRLNPAPTPVPAPAPAVARAGTAPPDEPRLEGRPSPATLDAGDGAGHPHGWRFEGGVGFRTMLPSGVPGGLLEGVLRNRAGGWGARLVLSGSWWSDADLGPGQVSWTRLAAGAGLIHGWSGARLFVNLHEDLLAAALVAVGRGFEETRRPAAFDPGVGAGVRGGIALRGLVRIWVDAGITWWPVKATLQVQGLEQAVVPSPFEASLSLGASLLSAR